MCECAHVCKYSCVSAGVHGVRKRLLDPWELELQAAVGQLVWALGTKLGSSLWTSSALTYGPISQAFEAGLLDYARGKGNLSMRGLTSERCEKCSVMLTLQAGAHLQKAYALFACWQTFFPAPTS